MPITSIYPAVEAANRTTGGWEVGGGDVQINGVGGSNFFAKIELGGSSVAVRAGVQLGVSVTSSMSSNSI